MGDPGLSGAVRYAVTTRSRLKSARFFAPMYRASDRVKRQLADTPGCLRFASVAASPREFWSISVWRSREEMQDFMRSGAHETFMWNFSRWFDSFWLVRWSPTEDEHGRWSGLPLQGQPVGSPTLPTMSQHGGTLERGDVPLLVDFQRRPPVVDCGIRL